MVHGKPRTIRLVGWLLVAGAVPMIALGFVLGEPIFWVVAISDVVFGMVLLAVARQRERESGTHNGI